jgi:Amt family ammonium transporter
VIAGGWLDKHYIQLAYQLADSVAGLSYSFVVTTIILWIMHFIPGLSLRTTEEAEILGVDDADMGEFAYDYVGLEQEIGHVVEKSEMAPLPAHAELPVDKSSTSSVGEANAEKA